MANERLSIVESVGVQRGFELIREHIAYLESENQRLNELLSTYYVNALRGDGEKLCAFIAGQGHDVHRNRKSLNEAIADFEAESAA